jgi:hypothetical protein
VNVAIGTTNAFAGALARAREIAADLGARYRVELRMPRPDTLHLVWFDGGTRRQPARPILTLTPSMIDDAAQAMAARIVTDGRVNKLICLTIGASVIRDHYVSRIPDGGDMTLAPLSPRYRAWKARKGLRTGIGEATGEMKRAMQSALIVVSRTA